MSDRARALANKFGDANNEMVKTVEGMSEDQWRAVCAGEERSAGVVAHHVASNYGVTFGIAQLGASGQPMPELTSDVVHGGNAQHATDNVNCTKEETLALLHDGGEKVKSGIASLSDEQLDQTLVLALFGPDEMTVEQLINGLVIGHINMHLPSIQETVA